MDNIGRLVWGRSQSQQIHVKYKKYDANHVKQI